MFYQLQVSKFIRSDYELELVKVGTICSEVVLVRPRLAVLILNSLVYTSYLNIAPISCALIKNISYASDMKVLLLLTSLQYCIDTSVIYHFVPTGYSLQCLGYIKKQNIKFYFKIKHVT